MLSLFLIFFHEGLRENMTLDEQWFGYKLEKEKENVKEN